MGNPARIQSEMIWNKWGMIIFPNISLESVLPRSAFEGGKCRIVGLRWPNG